MTHNIIILLNSKTLKLLSVHHSGFCGTLWLALMNYRKYLILNNILYLAGAPSLVVTATHTLRNNAAFPTHRPEPA